MSKAEITVVEPLVIEHPDGEILCEGVHNAVCESCRVLMSRGITGPFETWKAGVPHACLRGDIERTAGLTISEPDIPDRDCKPRFKRWRPYPNFQNVLPLHSVDSPVSEEDVAGRVVAPDTIARSGEKVGTTPVVGPVQ